MINPSKSIPLISVVMSVYNGADHVSVAIDSILTQDFKNFEFIIVDDGSTDETAAILAKYKARDPRVIVISQSNMGLTKALNNGIKEASGHYIARQDADDVALPHRLGTQLEFMEQNNDVVLCGANCVNVSQNQTRSHWGWEDDNTLSNTLYYKTPFAHSTAFIRKTALDKVGGYNERYKTSQDTELWMRLAKCGRVSMIQEPLIERYVMVSSISVKRRWRQFFDALHARLAHAPPHKKVQVIIHSLRSLAISFIPDHIIKCLKKDRIAP